MCLLLMLWGILLFGNLLAELADINHAANFAGSRSPPESPHRWQPVPCKVVVCTCNEYFATSCPRHICSRAIQCTRLEIALHTDVLRWVRFYHGHQAQNVKKKDLLAQLPGAIQRQMVFCIFGEVCLRVCGAHDVQTHVPTDSYT